MIADRGIVNYFDVRWADGYGHVSDAAGSLAVAIEEVCRTVSNHGDAVTLATRAIRGGQVVGLVRFDTVTSSGPRTLTYVHAAALPPGHALDDEGWRRLVARRYGDDPAARIRDTYEQMAVTTRDDGSDLLAPFRFDDDDLAAVLGPPRPSASAPAMPAPAAGPSKDTRRDAGGRDAGPGGERLAVGGRPPVIRVGLDEEVAAARRPRRALFAVALVAAAVVAVVAGVRLTRPAPRGPDAAEVAALRAQVETLTQERDVAVETLAQRSATVQDLTTRLSTCEARIKVSDVEAQLRLQLADVKRSEATLADKVRRLEGEYATCVKNQAP